MLKLTVSVIALMAAMPAAAHETDYEAYLKKVDVFGLDALEFRDGASLTDVKETIDGIQSAFATFKEKNDERLKQLEKGSEDVVTAEQVDKINKEIQDLIDVKDRLEKLETRLARPGFGVNQEELTPEQREHKDAFLRWARTPNDQRAQLALQEKAVDTQSGTAGGNAVPEVISRTIEQNLIEVSPMRQVATVESVGTPDYKKLIDVRGTTGGWVGETAVRTETDTSSLEQIAPTFGEVYAYPKATEHAMNDMFIDVETWLINSAVEEFSKLEGAAFIGGDGANKPTGFLSGPKVVADDATRPFGSLQQLDSGAAAGFAPTNGGDVLIDIVHALKAGYRANAVWMANRLTLAEVRKLKDADGQYLWAPGLQQGMPDRLLGYRVVEAEDMPDIEANSVPMAFGDFRAGYLITDLVAPVRLTMDEVTQPGYIKFFIRKRVGGHLMKDEAIKVLRIRV